MYRQYDLWLVALSVAVAVIAGYVALDLAGRVAVARGAIRRGWLAAGALALGVGIWSMHFIGMLAFRLHHAPGGRQLPMTYEVPELVLSVLVAVLASGLALAVVGRERLPGLAHLAASLAMGGAIAGMHYIGMAGLRVPSRMEYDPWLVAASLLIACGASFAALWLAFRLRDQESRTGRRRRAAAALLIGAAIAGMHYTGMTAARFAGGEPGLPVHQHAVLATDGLSWAVTGATVLILGLALAGTALDRAFRARLAHAEEVQRLYAAAEAARGEAEWANQQLQEQAVELEHQVEEAQSLAEELEQTNAELQRALADAERAQQAAELASRAKGDLLATMSHELRTPLNAIQGHVQLLAMELHGPLTDAQRTALGRVERAQRHLLALINDVLNLARLESGRVEYDVRVVLVADVLQDVEQVMLPLLAGKQLAFDLRLPESDGHPPLPVGADRDKLSQILFNLLSNAAKFTPAGGRVTVSAREHAADAGLVEIRVTDTGVGIPADQLSRIFEPFVQLRRGVWTESQQGTGLGLAISRDLARGMGGDLTVESMPAEGSSFTLTLPRA